MFVCEKCEGVGYHKPGCPDYPMTTAPPACGHDFNALVDVDLDGHAVCSECVPSLSDRPALVVPDSPDVRERLPFTIDDGNPRVLTFKSGGCRPAKETETAMWDLLAAVGQGVTAAQAWDECVQAVAWAMDNGPDPLRYVAEHNPYRAVVRSGEQGGEA